MAQGSPDRDRPSDAIVNGYAPPPLPARPTQAIPGSDSKIRIMALRASRGLALFHPDDARGNPDEDLIDQDTWLPPIARLPSDVFCILAPRSNDIEVPRGNT